MTTNSTLIEQLKWLKLHAIQKEGRTVAPKCIQEFVFDAQEHIQAQVHSSIKTSPLPSNIIHIITDEHQMTSKTFAM